MTAFAYLLDTSCGGGALPCSLGGELLARGLATGGLASCLLGTSHGDCAAGGAGKLMAEKCWELESGVGEVVKSPLLKGHATLDFEGCFA